MQPAFLIAGAQRSGTSSMYRALSEHPNVLPAVLQKGVHYFDLTTTQGLAWYRSHFPLPPTADARAAPHRRRRPSPSSRALTTSSTRWPAAHRSRPPRASRSSACVRDPVERAFSAHAHELARGYETEPFERALDLEPERTAGERDRMVADPTYNSFACSTTPICRAASTSTSSSSWRRRRARPLLVVDSHRLFEDAGPAMAEVFDFLELPQPSGITFEQHNARPRTPMPDGLRERLEDHFRPYDERLAQWLGWTPRWMA